MASAVQPNKSDQITTKLSEAQLALDKKQIRQVIRIYKMVVDIILNTPPLPYEEITLMWKMKNTLLQAVSKDDPMYQTVSKAAGIISDIGEAAGHRYYPADDFTANAIFELDTMVYNTALSRLENGVQALSVLVSELEDL